MVIKAPDSGEKQRAGFALLGRHYVPSRAFAGSLLGRCASRMLEKAETNVAGDSLEHGTRCSGLTEHFAHGIAFGYGCTVRAEYIKHAFLPSSRA